MSFWTFIRTPEISILPEVGRIQATTPDNALLQIVVPTIDGSDAELAVQLGIRVVVPPPAHCTDNAAMIAFAGSLLLARGEDHAERLTMSPHTALMRVTRKGAGRR